MHGVCIMAGAFSVHIIEGFKVISLLKNIIKNLGFWPKKRERKIFLLAHVMKYQELNEIQSRHCNYRLSTFCFFVFVRHVVAAFMVLRQ